MNRMKKLQAVTGIIVSFAVLYVIGRLTLISSCMPGMVFWIVAELFLFADGYTVYSMVSERMLTKSK